MRTAQGTSRYLSINRRFGRLTVQRTDQLCDVSFPISDPVCQAFPLFISFQPFDDDRNDCQDNASDLHVYRYRVELLLTETAPYALAQLQLREAARVR